MHYDAYAMADWSAASTPVNGKDSIWVAVKDGVDAKVHLTNYSTRLDAVTWLKAFAEALAASDRRALIGFDFAFGYPRGAAERMTGSPDWRDVWAFFGRAFELRADNANARFEVANELNATAFSSEGDGPFWGHPAKRSFSTLFPKKPAFHRLREHRLVEERVPSAKSVWQMCYVGAVGGQTMTGISALERCRNYNPSWFSVWPFETGFQVDAQKPVTLCEIYPSLLPVRMNPAEVKDAAQVRTVVEHVADLDREGRLQEWLGPPKGLSDADLNSVLTEEGWIAGANFQKPGQLS